jgi:Zn-dependent peptidase ImmA (M78 family)
LVDRLDPLELAKHLAIPVLSAAELAKFGASHADIDRATRPACGWSAATICRGSYRTIVYNPLHSGRRRANSLAHELAHVILDHDPAPLLQADGSRHWNSEQEGEANWLAGALLVPRAAVLQWLRDGNDLHSGAAHFGVSVELITWRARHTGVIRQLERTRALSSYV